MQMKIARMYIATIRLFLQLVLSHIAFIIQVRVFVL